MKILSKDKSNLIDRTEVIVEFQHEGKPTPSTKEMKKAIADDIKADENLVVIKLIDTKFGSGLSIISAYVYDSLEELKKLEKYEEPKQEEKPAEEAPKVEAPVKEKKEEAPKENGKESETKE
jgi:small subunit ribosomal protein S24e